MPSQRIILGIGLAILLVIGAASIGLDLKSRSDAASVDRALGILSKLSDMRPLLRRAESAARAFALTGDQEFAREYREASDAILPALALLIEAVKDNPTEKQLIEQTKALVERQIAVNGELIRLRNAGGGAAAADLVRQEDREATATIGVSGLRSWNIRIDSKPRICGMNTSISMTSNSEVSSARIPASPPSATVTSKPLRVRQTSMATHTSGSSSTTRTRGTMIPSSLGGDLAARTSNVTIKSKRRQVVRMIECT